MVEIKHPKRHTIALHFFRAVIFLLILALLLMGLS